MNFCQGKLCAFFNSHLKCRQTQYDDNGNSIEYFDVKSKTIDLNKSAGSHAQKAN